MTSNIYQVQGVTAAGVAAGLKKDGALDMALICSARPAAAAGVFTRNRVQAAPVIVSREHVSNGRAGAVVVNSGCANACTGPEGLAHARKTAELTARELGIAPEDVLVASTGVIGAPLDMDRVSDGIPELVKGLSPDGISRAAEAIMTTDTFPKISRFRGRAGGRSYGIIGIAKGAGMIMPDMATMLCFVLTDIEIGAPALRAALAECVSDTFNRITVDGDTSTNDMVLALANGSAGNGSLSKADTAGFRAGLRNVLEDLARLIVRDGEGATKLIHVEVAGAASPSDAERAVRCVANSSLVKTAFYGEDPNWGRIMAALGRSGAAMEETIVSIWINGILLVEGGIGKGAAAEADAAREMKGKELTLAIDLGRGDHRDRVTTCDLTHDYISINADYRS